MGLGRGAVILNQWPKKAQLRKDLKKMRASHMGVCEKNLPSKGTVCAKALWCTWEESAKACVEGEHRGATRSGI